MYMSDAEYNERIKEVEMKNDYFAKKRAIREAKKYGLKFKKPSTSHMVLWAIIIISVQIVLFSERIILETGDTTQLYSLIGIPVALIPIVVSYFSKSAKENTAGGIVYDAAMRSMADDEAAG